MHATSRATQLLTAITLLLVLSMLSMLSACGSPPTADEVRQQTSSVIGPMIVETAKAADRAAAHKTIGMLLDFFDIDRPDQRDDLERGANDAAQELERALAELFSEENVESTDGDTTTFLVRGEGVCSETSIGVRVAPRKTPTATDPAPSSDLPSDRTVRDVNHDSGCPAVLRQIELRIDARLAGDGVDLGLRVGSSTVLTLEVRSDRLTAKLDLPAARAAALELAAKAGEKLDLPQIAGVIAATVARVGTDSVKVSVSLLEALSVTGTTDEGDYHIQVPAADPLVALTLGDEVALDIDTGLADIAVPARAIIGGLKQPLAEMLNIALQGTKAKVRASADGTIKIEQLELGSGPSTLKLGDKLLAQLEVNPDDGHALTGEIILGEQPQCIVSPKLDIRAEFAWAQLDPVRLSPAPTWAADERYQLLLSAVGGNPAIELLAPKADDMSPPDPLSFPPSDGTTPDTTPGASITPLLRVLDGTLVMQSFVEPHKVTVDAGQCLRVDASSSNATPVAAFSAGGCSAN